MSVASRYDVLPARYDGTMSPYNFEAVAEAPAVPDSLRPFFINYVGRHGARFLSSESKVTAVRKALYEAHKRGSLTRTGQRFLLLLDKVSEVTSGRWGALNETGESEQRRLAEEMMRMWPEVMQSGKVQARSTFVPRVVMSMYTFCHTLAADSDSLEIYTDEGKQNNDLLRYFDTDTAYVSYLDNGAWKKGYAQYLAANAPYEPALRLTGRNSGMDTVSLRRLSMDIYGVLQSLRAAGLEPPTTEWMTRDEYRKCWEVSNLKHYLQRVANRYSDIAAVAAMPLLRELCHTADSVIAEVKRGERQTLKANLLFGHAETLMPLLSLMGLPGCDPCYENCLHSLSVSKDFADLSTLWNDRLVSPLAANLEMVYFLSPTNNVYVLLRLNGRNIPPKEGLPLINPWDTLKRHFHYRFAVL